MIELLIVGGSAIILIVAGSAVATAMQVLPFAYPAARVRSAKSKMLSDAELVEWTHLGYKDILYHLEKKGYHQILSLIESNFREEKVQNLLRKAQYKDLHAVSQHVPRKYKKFFSALASRLEIENILSTLRSKTSPSYQRHKIKEILLQTQYFKDPSAIESATLEETLSILQHTPYAKIINAHLEEIRNGNLHGLEHALSIQYYKKLRRESRIDPVLRAYVALMIDAHNIKKTLCFSQPSFIEGGTLSQTQKNQLKEAKNIQEVIQACENTAFADVLKDVKSQTELLQALERKQKRFAQRLLKEEPLSIKPIIAYYILRNIELKNIRILLKLKHARFDQQEIARALI
ncbi:hypothetical protein D6774_04345 [Candidatus Woesearchaeota archaeon]|nr:MAG: hypothetical protein D6774_04345 [Candidatus Woesearchaeota archaeon]